MAKICEPIATIRNQNSRRNAPLAPAVSTKENLCWVKDATDASLHRRFVTSHAPPPCDNPAHLAPVVI